MQLCRVLMALMVVLLSVVPGANCFGLLTLTLLIVAKIKGAVLAGVPLAVGGFLLGEGLGFLKGTIFGKLKAIKGIAVHRYKQHHDHYGHAGTAQFLKTLGYTLGQYLGAGPAIASYASNFKNQHLTLKNQQFSGYYPGHFSSSGSGYITPATAVYIRQLQRRRQQILLAAKLKALMAQQGYGYRPYVKNSGNSGHLSHTYYKRKKRQDEYGSLLQLLDMMKDEELDLSPTELGMPMDDIPEELIEDTPSQIEELKDSDDKTQEPLIPTQLMSEIETFFTVVASYDQNDCLQKMVCDIHARQDQEDYNPTEYEFNVIAVFKLLNAVLPFNLRDKTYNYRLAANLGENSREPDMCKSAYTSCTYDTPSILKMAATVKSKEET